MFYSENKHSFGKRFLFSTGVKSIFSAGELNLNVGRFMIKLQEGDYKNLLSGKACHLLNYN